MSASDREKPDKHTLTVRTVEQKETHAQVLDEAEKLDYRGFSDFYLALARQYFQKRDESGA